MKITIAKDAGYCFGVRDAVNMAYDAAEKYGEVNMLGSIVHNEKVVEGLEGVGAKTINNIDDISGKFTFQKVIFHHFCKSPFPVRKYSVKSIPRKNLYQNMCTLVGNNFAAI